MPQSSQDTYKIFFSLSILTDTRKFQALVMRQGGVPYHNLKSFDWKGLGGNVADVLLDKQPEYRDCVSVNFFNDSLESATKPVLSESQMFGYLKALIKRAKADDFRAGDLRTRTWLTTHKESAPPQDFNAVIEIQDDGSVDAVEAVIDGLVTHFFASTKAGGLSMMPLLFSGKLAGHSKLSDAMLGLLSKSFDHPFANDVAVMLLNEAQQDNIAQAASMRDVETSQSTLADNFLSR